jgi:hypothetical protein
MERVSTDSIMVTMFGLGKGSGAGMMIFILGILGMILCLAFGRVLRKYKYQELV